MVVLWRDWESSPCEIYEFEDGKDLEHCNLHFNQLTEFCFPHEAVISGSANGLLLLVKLSSQSENLYVCNPITRDYVEVPFPREILWPCPRVIKFPDTGKELLDFSHSSINYGFGVSKITGQHKVVRIIHDSINAHEGQPVPGFGCHVHTLGTGSWSPVDCGAWFSYGAYTPGVLVNGNLHWIVSDSYSKMWISCFDLETEQFSNFSLPPLHEGSNERSLGLSALGGCLCLCDHSGGLIGIWLMKDYGVEKSWSKEYEINKSEDINIGNLEIIYPLKWFEDGDILMLEDDLQLLWYSRETGTALGVGNAKGDYVNSIIFTPTFLSLKSLGMENVLSF